MEVWHSNTILSLHSFASTVVVYKKLVPEEHPLSFPLKCENRGMQAIPSSSVWHRHLLRQWSVKQGKQQLSKSGQWLYELLRHKPWRPLHITLTYLKIAILSNVMPPVCVWRGCERLFDTRLLFCLLLKRGHTVSQPHYLQRTTQVNPSHTNYVCLRSTGLTKSINH